MLATKFRPTDEHHDCHVDVAEWSCWRCCSLWHPACFRHPARPAYEPPVDTKAATAAPAVSKPAPGARDQGPAALAAAQVKAEALAAALAGSPVPPDSGDGVPAFDIARIEPTGEAVIAGRATPGATVELLRNGELH